MIQTERTRDGVTIGMSGSINDLIIEATVALKDILKHIPEEKRVGVMADISCEALLLAREDKDTKGNAVTIEKPDVLEEAIKKTTGGK